MTKLVFLLWDPVDLRDSALHESLAGVGVRRLQVNLDDEHVTGALRLQAFDEPVRAVVSAWTDGDPAAVAALLGDVSSRRPSATCRTSSSRRSRRTRRGWTGSSRSSSHPPR